MIAIPPAEHLLIITGSMGAGKTTVAAEASDLLAQRNIPHAIIDLDALGTAHLPPGIDANNNIAYDNLEAVWKNFAALGLTRLLLSGAMETRADLERCCTAIAAAKTVVCRLTASIETMQRRVRNRERGVFQDRYVARVAELNAALDRVHLEDFSVANEDRPLTDVAHEVLTRAGWI